MKVFAIKDAEQNNRIIGYLFYYEKATEFVIELDESLDEWQAPVLFSGLVKKEIYTIPKDICKLWVEERIVPSGRHNIGMILKSLNTSEYNEGLLLRAGKGKSAQDLNYLEEIKEVDLPEWVVKRRKSNLMESFISADNSVVCFLMDGTVRKAGVKDLAKDVPKLETIQDNRRLLETVKVDVGGYGIVFNDSIAVEKRIFIKRSKKLNVSAGDFYTFAEKNIVNTGEACVMMECSRQNLAYLIKINLLKPIKTGWKENLFFKGSIDKAAGE